MSEKTYLLLNFEFCVRVKAFNALHGTCKGDINKY